MRKIYIMYYLFFSYKYEKNMSSLSKEGGQWGRKVGMRDNIIPIKSTILEVTFKYTVYECYGKKVMRELIRSSMRLGRRHKQLYM